MSTTVRASLRRHRVALGFVPHAKPVTRIEQCGSEQGNCDRVTFPDEGGCLVQGRSLLSPTGFRPADQTSIEVRVLLEDAQAYHGLNWILVPSPELDRRVRISGEPVPDDRIPSHENIVRASRSYVLRLAYGLYLEHRFLVALRKVLGVVGETMTRFGLAPGEAGSR